METEQERRKRVLDGLKMTNKGETICLSYEQARIIVEWLTELKSEVEKAWGSDQ